MFCSPSVWDEPFGLVNVEALASGLPVVSTLGGGASEIFAGGGGILVERRSAAELASALRRLVESPELRTRLGQQGYAAFLERFTWSNARAQVTRSRKRSPCNCGFGCHETTRPFASHSKPAPFPPGSGLFCRAFLFRAVAILRTTSIRPLSAIFFLHLPAVHSGFAYSGTGTPIGAVPRDS